MCPSGVYISKWHFEVNVGKKWFKSASKGTVQRAWIHCRGANILRNAAIRLLMVSCICSGFCVFVCAFHQYSNSSIYVIALTYCCCCRCRCWASARNDCKLTKWIFIVFLASCTHTHTHSDVIRQRKPMKKTEDDGKKNWREIPKHTNRVPGFSFYDVNIDGLQHTFDPKKAKCAFISTREKLNWISFQWKTYLPFFLSGVLCERNSFWAKYAAESRLPHLSMQRRQMHLSVLRQPYAAIYEQIWAMWEGG